MKCPQCNHENEKNVTNCKKCEFPFMTKTDPDNQLKALLDEIDEEFDLDDEEDEEDEEEISLPADTSVLLPLRMGSLAEIRGFIQEVIDCSDGPEKELKVLEQDLQEMMNDFQEEVDSHLEEMDQMVFSPQMWEAMKKPVMATRKAFDLYDSTLAEIRLYFNTKNTEHLERGLALEEEANMFLSHAFNLVRESMTSILGF